MSETTVETPAATVPVKETKAQKAERLKREKNPWDAWDEVREFARLGRESVTPEWNTYFRWWGIYTQGDGNGVTGGVGGEGKATEFFMQRIALPNGLLTARQLRGIADITKNHARGIADLTTRQNIQLHWLTIQSLPEVNEKLEEIGLSSKGACGDVVRNVTGCPLAGLDGHELIDSSALAVECAKKLTGNPEFYNLPRKFKISVTGCPMWCSYPEINDVALTALKRVKDRREKKKSATAFAWVEGCRTSRILRCGCRSLSRRRRRSMRCARFARRFAMRRFCARAGRVRASSTCL